MNTPPKPKPIIRFGSREPTPRLPAGELHIGVKTDAIATRLGKLASIWPHVEEAMVEVLAIILDDHSNAARLIFRSIINQHTRIEVLRNLLQKSTKAEDLGVYVDEAIDEFAALNLIRNGYLHGMWTTDIVSGKVYIGETAPEHWVFLPIRRVTEKELDLVIKRMNELHVVVRTGTSAVRDGRLRDRHEASRKTPRGRRSRTPIPNP